MTMSVSPALKSEICHFNWNAVTIVLLAFNRYSSQVAFTARMCLKKNTHRKCLLKHFDVRHCCVSQNTPTFHQMYHSTQTSRDACEDIDCLFSALYKFFITFGFASPNKISVCIVNAIYFLNNSKPAKNR